MAKVKRNTPIPEKKKKTVKELVNLIQTKKTILITSIKGLPASQFQAIGKKLRGKAIVKVPKKNLMKRAVDDSKVLNFEDLKKQIKSDTAILFSDVDSYELAADLIKNKSPTKAKTGQEAPFDIEVKAGMTELVPGPAISELGAVGLTTKVSEGKLEIMQDKVIVAQGKKISQGAADVMSKLNILPFSIGYIPLSAFEPQTGKSYFEIEIDEDVARDTLIEAYSKALSFAVEIGYTSSDTIKLMIMKATSYEKKLIRVISGEPEEETAPVVTEETETPKEEAKEEKVETSTEGLASLFG